MKFKLLLLLTVLCMLFTSIAVSTCAAASDEATAEAVLTYEGVSARLKGEGYGIRSVWMIDKAKVADLESKGYTVAVGAVMGISEYKGVTYNATSDSLTVTPNDYLGAVSDNTAAEAIVVYGTGNAAYASRTYIAETENAIRFAYTTTYGKSSTSDALLNAKLVYRGFVILTKEGASTIYYDNAVPETAPIDEQISLSALSSFFMNDYAGADAESFKTSEKICEVVAMCGKDYSLADATLKDDSMKLSDGASIRLGTSKSNTASISVNVSVAGYYRIDALVNYNGGYVDYLYCKNAKTGVETAGRLGTNNDAAKALNDTAEEVGAVTSIAPETIGYTYLAKDDNTLSFYASRYVSVKDVTLTLVANVNTADGDLVRDARNPDSSVIDNTNPVGKLTEYQDGILLRADANGQNSATYKIKPSVSGLYSVALLASTASSGISVTLESENGEKQVLAYTEKNNIGGCSSGASVLLPNGTLSLVAGETYSLTLTNAGNQWFYVRQIALCFEGEISGDAENETGYEILFKDMKSKPSNATLLADGRTYYMARANGTFTYFLTVPTAGVYGVRMKYVNTVGGTTYRTQFYLTSTEHPEYTRSRIAGSTTAYNGDGNAFIFPVSERNSAYAETVAYQYLSEGTNEVTLYVENNTYATGFYGLEYYLVSTNEDVRMTAADSQPTLTLNPSISETDRKFNTTSKNLFLRNNDKAEWTNAFTVTESGVYTVHSLVAQDKNTLTYTFTNTETGEAYTSTYTGAANMGSCSTSITAVTLSSVVLPEGTYTFSITTTGSWLNFADVRLTRDKTVSFMEAGETGDTVSVTPEKDGYYDITSSMDGTASVALLLNGVEIASSEATDSAAVETRTLTRLFLKKGTTYRFSLKNTGNTECVASAPATTFVGERTLANGYFADLSAEDAAYEERRLELSKGNVSEGVTFVDANGTEITLSTGGTSETVPYSHCDAKKPANAAEFGYKEGTSYTGIKMKDGTGSSPLGIKFTVATAGNYDISILYSTASASGSAKVSMGIDSLPDTAVKTVLYGESNRTHLHKATLGSAYLTAGEHTVYLHNSGNYTFWLHAVDLARTDATDFTFTPAYSGVYRVTAYLTSGEAVNFKFDAAMKSKEGALLTGDVFSANVPASDSESAVFVSRNYSFMAGVDYTVRISLPASRIAGISFDLVEGVEKEIIRLPESDHTGVVTDTNDYTDPTYQGFSLEDYTVNNAAAYGYTSSKILTWRSQDKGSGNKVIYDPMGIRFSVEASGYYDISLVYFTGGTSAAIAAYIDGDFTSGYWKDGYTVNEETKRLEGTWVQYVYSEGDNGKVLSEKLPCPNSAGGLAEVKAANSVYLERGEHIFYMVNVGSYTIRMADVRIEAHDASSDYKDFSSMVSFTYDEERNEVSASVSASGRNSKGFPGYRIVFTAYGKNDTVLGSVYYDSTDFVTEAVNLTVENVAGYERSVVAFTDASGATLAPDFEHTLDDYRVIFLSDTHLYDWEEMFFDNSAQRTAWAVEAALKEHAFSPIDAVVLPGDVVNNYLREYEAGTFAGWEYVDEDGVTHTSQYKGVSYPAGSSGTENDPLGVLRILSFMELVEPLTDAGIPVYAAHGNHDCYRDTIFEMGFKTNQSEGYIGGALQYESDENGNLLVPDYKIENGEISLYTKVVTPDDPTYTGYKKGYGKDYAFALNDTTAFMIFDNYYNRSEDPTDNGFIANASGRSWGEQLIAEETVDTLVALTASYKDVYVTLHSMTTNQTYLKTVLKENDNIVSVFDGHTHYETATPNAYGTGKYVFTCGYFGVPMLNDQAYFMERPFSYRMLDKNGSTLRTYIVLPEKDYPEYTFTGSSNATIPAFYQKYLRRKATVIR